MLLTLKIRHGKLDCVAKQKCPVVFANIPVSYSLLYLICVVVFCFFVFLAGLSYKTAACQSVCRIAQNCRFLQQKATLFFNKLLNQIQEKERIIGLMAVSYTHLTLPTMAVV